MVQCFGALCISSRSRKSHSYRGTVIFAGREVLVKVGIWGGGLALPRGSQKSPDAPKSDYLLIDPQRVILIEIF